MIFNAIDKHLYTIIILHGMFQTNRDVINLANNIQNHNHNIKVILPSAPKRNISWSLPPEINVSSWYDYYTRKDGWLEHDDINIEHFTEQTGRIFNILDKETEYISPKKIIISGISQGGTLALNIGLKYHKKLAGILGIHTVFMDNIIDINNIKKIPIYLFSGKEDKIYNIKLQEKCFNILKNNNIQIYWNIQKKIGHCEFSLNEIPFILDSINNILM